MIDSLKRLVLRCQQSLLLLRGAEVTRYGYHTYYCREPHSTHLKKETCPRNEQDKLKYLWTLTLSIWGAVIVDNKGKVLFGFNRHTTSLVKERVKYIYRWTVSTEYQITQRCIYLHGFWWTKKILTQHFKLKRNQSPHLTQPLPADERW